MVEAVMAVQLKTKRTSVILCRVFCLILVCVLAYNWQRIFYIECIDGMISDVPNHVKLAMGHNDYGRRAPRTDAPEPVPCGE